MEWRGWGRDVVRVWVWWCVGGWLVYEVVVKDMKVPRRRGVVSICINILEHGRELCG